MPIKHSSSVQTDILNYYPTPIQLTCHDLVANDIQPGSKPHCDPMASAPDLPVGYVVTQVTANDVDLGSTISYSLLDHGDSDSASGCFAIDRYSGVITLTRALDYEERTEHVLGVRA